MAKTKHTPSVHPLGVPVQHLHLGLTEGALRRVLKTERRQKAAMLFPHRFLTDILVCPVWPPSCIFEMEVPMDERDVS